MIKPSRSQARALFIGLIGLTAIGAYVLYSVVRSTILRQQDQLASARAILVQSTQLRPPSREGVAYFGHLQDIRALKLFAGAYYAATAGGLVVFDDQGRVVAHHTTLEGLPENSLKALEVFRGQLYIGTASQGLLSTDGQRFTHHRFVQPETRQVTALAAMDDGLLIGTFDGGLFRFDSEQFRRATPPGRGLEPRQVTIIVPRYPDIYVGTFADGLFVWHGGRWDQLTTRQGLPSDRVTSILDNEDGVLISTDLGVVQLRERSQMTPVAQIGNIASLARFEGKIYGGLFTGQIALLDANRASRPSQSQRDDLTVPGNPKRLTLTSENGRLWALTSNGIYSCSNPGAAPFMRFDQDVTTFQLSASHVSALAMDWRGRLWIGYFDQGIDIIDPHQPRLIAQMRDEAIREINFLCSDEKRRSMLTATSAGLAEIDERLRPQWRTEKDGLISNSVAHVLKVPAHLVAPRPDDRPRFEEALLIATGRGLSALADGIFRSLNAFHGLASNHLYTSARLGNRIYVGSLNGLNELEGLRVVRAFQTATSGLSHNWVAALAAVGDTLYIGTYGGGVDALLPSGEMINFANLIGKFSVNPNAMHFDGERLYVGTLEQGVWVLRLETDTWLRFTQGLSSNNVTAIASDERFVYFGTDQGLTLVDRRRLR